MNLQIDRAFARVVVDQIEDYIQSEVLFWPVGNVGGLQFPQLTIGAWLETEWRLAALEPDSAELAAARTAVRKYRSHAAEPYNNKAQREFKSRLDSWTLYLDETLERVINQEAIAAELRPGYHANVRHRFKLELLKDHVPQVQVQVQRLNMLDMRLRSRFKDGDFIWEPELRNAAPKDPFWWLWGGL